MPQGGAWEVGTSHCSSAPTAWAHHLGPVALSPSGEGEWSSPLLGPKCHCCLLGQVGEVPGPITPLGSAGLGPSVLQEGCFPSHHPSGSK